MGLIVQNDLGGSARRLRVSSAIAIPRKKLLGSGDKFRAANVQGFSKFKNCCERGAVFPAFQKTYVLWMVSALEREALLSHVPFLAQLKKGASKRPLFPGSRCDSSCHLQPGVSDESTNTSTKYTIHLCFYSDSWSHRARGSDRCTCAVLAQSIRRDCVRCQCRAQPKLSSLSRYVKPQRTPHQKTFFRNVEPNFDDNHVALSTSFFLRLPAVCVFQQGCRRRTWFSLTGVSFVPISEQNPAKRRFVRDRFRTPLAVIGCLDDLLSGLREAPSTFVRLLFAVDEHPPKAQLERMSCGFRCRFRAALG